MKITFKRNLYKLCGLSKL